MILQFVWCIGCFVTLFYGEKIEEESSSLVFSVVLKDEKSFLILWLALGLRRFSIFG